MQTADIEILRRKKAPVAFNYWKVALNFSTVLPQDFCKLMSEAG